MKWSKSVVSSVLLLSLLISPAMAVDFDYVLKQNSMQEAQWVNWTPDNLPLSESVVKLAKQLSAEAITKEQIPKLVHDWVCENIYYDGEDLDRQSYSALAAEDVLRTRRGVCEGIANLVQALFIANDIPCIKVWGVAIGDDSTWETANIDFDRVNHTWNEYYVSGKWVSLDCTMDMRNQYEADLLRPGQWRSDYFDPEASFFAQTHLILQRSFDLPENIPSDWAKPGITAAVEMETIPLRFFSNYRSSITAYHFSLLFSLPPTDSTASISRRQAALLLAPRLTNSPDDTAPPYLDVASCSVEEQDAIRTLFHCGIMQGDGLHFMPDAELTYQDALVIIARINGLER